MLDDKSTLSLFIRWQDRFEGSQQILSYDDGGLVFYIPFNII